MRSRAELELQYIKWLNRKLDPNELALVADAFRRGWDLAREHHESKITEPTTGPMYIKVTCMQNDCGDISEFHSKTELLQWIKDINPHGMHYPAQRSNAFLVEMTDHCPPRTEPKDCPYNRSMRING